MRFSFSGAKKTWLKHVRQWQGGWQSLWKDFWGRPWQNLSSIGTLIAGVATLVTLVFWYRQISTQVAQIELENRPYLYIDVNPVAFDAIQHRDDGTEYYDLYLGAQLVYKNVGKTPACNIKIESHMYNDAVRTDDAKRLKEYFIGELGAEPKVTAIFPQQTIPSIPLVAADTKGGAKQYWISIRASYTGQTGKESYWYSFDGQFHIDRSIETREVVTSQGRQKVLRKNYRVLLLDSKTNYDGFGQLKMPLPLSNPYQEIELTSKEN